MSIPVCHYRQMLTDLIQHGTHDGELTTEQKIEAAKAYAMLRQAEADLELAEAVRGAGYQLAEATKEQAFGES